MSIDFWSECPEYRDTAIFDHLRSEQYPQLDEQGHVYLDYAGSGLTANAQTGAHADRMRSQIAGNPHSVSPASEISTTLINATRERVLKFLNANPKEYAVIFTANATGAARLIGEAYPFTRRSSLVLSADNHNSINGLRCFAAKAHARTIYIPLDPQELRINTASVEQALSSSNSCWSRGKTSRGLFAYPAQSNFSGVHHPLSWIELAQNRGYDVLLDAAAYLPSTHLDLSVVHPDYVIMSWYKIFGFPTGVGSLVAKWSSLSKLQRPWFSGGTVDGVMVKQPWHAMAGGEAGFEDGTVNFLSIADLLFGLQWFATLDLKVLTTRLQCLTRWMVRNLQSLVHDNGVSLIKLHGPLSSVGRGATIAFSVVDEKGQSVDELLVGAEAAAAKISIRVGCFCNPGANEATEITQVRDLGKPSKRIRRWLPNHNAPFRPLAGAVRVSLGTASNLVDVEVFLEFIQSTYKNRASVVAKPPNGEAGEGKHFDLV